MLCSGVRMTLFRKWRERRKQPRTTAIATAWIDAGYGQPPLVCVLWDISEGGARLALAAPDKLPEQFSLLALRGDRIGVRCRVIWRSPEQVGLQFLEDAAPILRVVQGQHESIG